MKPDIEQLIKTLRLEKADFIPNLVEKIQKRAAHKKVHRFTKRK